MHQLLISPPGASIKAIFSRENISLLNASKKTEIPESDLREIIAGKKTIDLKLSEQLSSITGTSKTFWSNRQALFFKAISEQNQIENEWLKLFPKKELQENGWLQQFSVDGTLEFFNSIDIEEWENTWGKYGVSSHLLRTSPTFAAERAALATWLRCGELLAEKSSCRSWSPKRLTEILPTLRRLSWTSNPAMFIPKLKSHLEDCGVALVILKPPKGCTASGATKFVSKDKALIQLSFRYLSDDHFWFTLFHEIGHLILHEHESFVESDDQVLDEKEREANLFAQNAIIPPKDQASIFSLKKDTKSIIKFAKDIGVAPGLIVGQLQHKGIVERNKLNYLKRRYVWIDHPPK